MFLLSSALLEPAVRLPMCMPPRSTVVRAQLNAEELLTKCNGSAEKLAALLKLKELKEECKKRDLPVSGTKLQLAPRLLDSMRAELASSPAYAAQPPPARVQQPQPPPTTVADVAVAHPPKRRAAESATPIPASDAATNIVMPRFDASGALIDCGAPAGTQSSSGADFELTILGSGACNPSPWRGASCAALRVKDSYWLFDVGEGTQVQLQKSSVRPSKIDKIFITHAHGDHCFGLPGLLCLIARGRDKGAKPLEIYGPAGLRSFVRATLFFTGTRMLPPYVVHEIHGIPNLRRSRAHGSEGGGGGGGGDVMDEIGAGGSRPADQSGATQFGGGNGDKDGSWGEVAGGTDQLPRDHRGWWELLHEGGGNQADTRGSNAGIRVSAAPVHHTVPTVGYVISEDDKEGRLQVEKVLPLLEKNRNAIREEMGIRDPRKLLSKIKELGSSGTLELPDGSIIRGSDVLGERRRGRKVVILGDCCDASLVAELGMNADLLVHEATNAYLPQFGDRGGAGPLERETARHGHSTPQMAGHFARRINARSLLLTHFSQRYHPANRGVMTAIASQAAAQAQLPKDCVAAAYDGLAVPLWQPDREKPLLPAEAFETPPQQQVADPLPLAPLA